MKAEQPRSLSFFSLWQKRSFQLHIIGFVVFNIVLYIWIMAAHNLAAFNRNEYTFDAQHFVTDSRISSPRSFNLLEGLGQYDAQWFMNIASNGYPRANGQSDLGKTAFLSYAYSPAYPALIAGVNVFVGSIEVSAFIVAQILLVLGFSLVYWLICRWYSAGLAAKTAWLVFLYPFSIFYRSYFSEGLFLILLIALMETVRSRKWFKAALSAGLLSVTRFVGVAGIMLLATQMLLRYMSRRLKLSRLAALTLLAIAPLAAFMVYCYSRTGDPLFFITVRSRWAVDSPVNSIITSIAHFGSLPWDHFHSSRLDVISIILFGSLVFFSRKWLPRTWWQLSLLLWLIPIISTDTMSASRFQIINLPIFIYLAHRLSGWQYRAAITLSAAGLFIIAIFFVNWAWIG